MIPKTWRGAIVQTLLDLEEEIVGLRAHISVIDEEIETLKKILDEKHAAAGKVMTILDKRVSALEDTHCEDCCPRLKYKPKDRPDEIVVSYTGTGEATK